MRAFAIVDGRRRKELPCAFILYEGRSARFAVVVCGDRITSRMPQPLLDFEGQGVRTLDGERSLAFAAAWTGADPSKPREVAERLSGMVGGSGADGLRVLEVPVTVRMQDAADARLADELLRAYRAQREGGAAASVGGLIRGERKRQRLTQQQLAERVGVQQAVVSRVERGQANPTVELLEDFARALGMRLELRLVDAGAGAAEPAAGADEAAAVSPASAFANKTPSEETPSEEVPCAR